MRTETDPVTGTQAGGAPLGAEERSDEAPRGACVSGMLAERAKPRIDAGKE